MHIENIKRLIHYVKWVPEENFDMSRFCGTSCCFAGHAHMLFFGKQFRDQERDLDPVIEVLGLSRRQARLFFRSHESVGKLFMTRREDALKRAEGFIRRESRRKAA